MNSPVEEDDHDLNETEQFSTNSNKEDANTVNELITYIKKAFQDASDREEAEEIYEDLTHKMGIAKPKTEQFSTKEANTANDKEKEELITYVKKALASDGEEAEEIYEDLTHKMGIAKLKLNETEQFSTKTNKEEANAVYDKEKEELITYVKKVLQDALDREEIEQIYEDLTHKMGIAKLKEPDTELEMQLAYEKISQFKKIDKQLQELKDQVLAKCRNMCIEEKSRILFDMRRLSSPADLTNAAIIIAGNELYFDEFNLNFLIDDEKSESLLWELKFFMNEKEFDDGDTRDLFRKQQDDSTIVVVEADQKQAIAYTLLKQG